MSYTGGYTNLPQGQYIYDPSALVHNTMNTTSFGSSISGLVYAIQAYGGFQTTRTFDNITRLPETLIAQFDVTGALEVVIPAKVFNAKVGIVKVDGTVINDSSRPYYDISDNMLYTDAINLSAQEFVNYMTDVSAAVPGNAAAQVVSVGTFSTLYTDFNLYVAQYFGFSNGNFPEGSEWGFGTLFSGELQFPAMQGNMGVFDASAFVALLRNTAWSDGSGGAQTQLSGDIQIAGITKLLRNAVDADPFNNRHRGSRYISSDMHDPGDYGVTDGFYPNDLLFIPNNGFQITLKVNIDSEAFTNPLNNINLATTGSTTNATGLTDAAGQANNFLGNTGAVSTTTGAAESGNQTSTITSSRTVSTTLLQRVVQAPLLIRLGETAGVDISSVYLASHPSAV